MAAADERKANMTDAQFYYKSRKKAMGPFKPEMWDLPAEAKEALYAALEAQFAFFYNKLNVGRHPRLGRPDRDRGGVPPAQASQHPRGGRRPGVGGLEAWFSRRNTAVSLRAFAPSCE